MPSHYGARIIVSVIAEDEHYTRDAITKIEAYARRFKGAEVLPDTEGPCDSEGL